MSIELKIPAVGESITEVQIGEWLKSEGDIVKQDEPLAVIDSEKTTFELTAPQNSRIAKILYQAGDTVAVGAVVAQLEPGDKAAKPQPAEPAAGSETKNAGQAKAKTETKAETKAETPAPAEKADKRKPAEPAEKTSSKRFRKRKSTRAGEGHQSTRCQTIDAGCQAQTFL